MSASFGKAGPKPSQRPSSGFASVRDSLRAATDAQIVRALGTDDAQLPRAKPAGLPRSWIAALWIAALGMAGFGATILPAFRTCYGMQQRGELYYGASVHGCTAGLSRKTIGEFQDKLERTIRGY